MPNSRELLTLLFTTKKLLSVLRLYIQCNKWNDLSAVNKTSACLLSAQRNLNAPWTTQNDDIIVLRTKAKLQIPFQKKCTDASVFITHPTKMHLVKIKFNMCADFHATLPFVKHRSESR